MSETSMNEIYGSQHLALQQAFETTNMAGMVKNIIVQPEVADEHKGFIETRDMFFLTTIDHRGYPTCSYKGGVPGFVRVVDSKTPSPSPAMTATACSCPWAT